MSKSLNLLVILALTFAANLALADAEYLPVKERDGYLVTPACDIDNYREVCIATIGDGEMTVGDNLGAQSIERFVSLNQFGEGVVTEKTKYPDGIVWLGTQQIYVTSR